MNPIRSVTLFCGSRVGHDPRCAAAARELGAGLAARGVRLVYGGGRMGLMGIAADAACAAGGTVLGVIPAFLAEREVAHPSLTSLEITDSMHSRKQILYREGEAFIGLPGGIGTLDELVEVITWRQLERHAKPILIADIGGSAQGLAAAIRATVEAGFTGPEVFGFFEILPSVAAVLDRLGADPGRSGVA